MKKFIKISAISAVIVALVLNLHSAALSFYGIETNTALASQVWSQSTSTDGTSGGGTGGDGTSTNGYGCWWWETCVKEQESYTTIATTNYVVTYISGTLKANVSNNVGVGFSASSIISLTETLQASFEGTFTAHFQSSTEYRDGIEITCYEVSTPSNCSPRRYAITQNAKSTSYTTGTVWR